MERGSDYDQAERALNSAPKKDEKELCIIRLNRAKLNIDLCDYNRVEEDLLDAQRVLKRIKDPKLETTLEQHRGLMCLQQQEYKEAEKHYNNALRLLKNPGDRKERGRALKEMGRISSEQADFPRAMDRYKEALGIARESGDASFEALVLNDQARVYLDRGDYAQAVKLYDESLGILGQKRMLHHYARALINKSTALFYSGEHQEAGQLVDKALDIARQTGVPEIKAFGLDSKAWFLKDTQSLNEAISCAMEAVDVAEQIQDRGWRAQSIQNLGEIYQYCGEFDLALDKLYSASKIQREIRHYNRLSEGLLMMADILTTRGQWSCEGPRNDAVPECAEGAFNEAIRIKAKRELPEAEALSKFALGYVEKDKYAQEPENATQRKDSLRKAREYLDRAGRKLNDERRREKMLYTYVRGACDLREKPAEALKQFQNLQSLAEASGSPKFTFLAWTGLGLAYQKLNDLAKAEKAFETAVDRAEEIRMKLSPQYRSTFLHGEEVLGMKHIVPYHGLARVRLLKGDWNKSLEAAEFAKGRAFADRMAQASEKISFDCDPQLVSRIHKAEKDISLKYQQLCTIDDKDGDPSQGKKLRNELKVLEKKLDEVKRPIREKYPKFYKSRFPQPTQITESGLKPEERALIYVVTDSGLLIYVTSGTSISNAMYKEVSRPELTKLVRKFLEPLTAGFCQDKLGSFDLKSGRELFKLLLSDMIPLPQQDDPLIVVPDGVLALLPFEMLIAGDNGRLVEGSPPLQTDDVRFFVTKGVRFLGDHVTLSYFQSINALSLARRWRENRKIREGVLVMVDPVFENDDERLARIGREDRQRILGGDADKMMGVLPGQEIRFKRLPKTAALGESLTKLDPVRTQLFKGLDSRKEVLTQGDLTPYRQLIVATHGYFGRQIAGINEPILVFTRLPRQGDQRPVGFLKMTEVMGLNLGFDSVALLACQSGQGAEIAGEGAMSMGRAFQYAGADSVLMSLWSVAEATTMRLAESFFTHLKAGKSNGGSTMRARRWGLPYWSLSQFLKHRVKNAVSYITNFEEALSHEARRRGFAGVVCGHIHKAEIRDIGGTLYCNDGDWVESLTALVETMGRRAEDHRLEVRSETP